MSAVDRRISDSMGAWLFLEAKVKEFEAACFTRSQGRINEAEEGCRSALSAALDAKRAVVEYIVSDANRR